MDILRVMHANPPQNQTITCQVIPTYYLVYYYVKRLPLEISLAGCAGERLRLLSKTKQAGEQGGGFFLVSYINTGKIEKGECGG